MIPEEYVPTIEHKLSSLYMVQWDRFTKSKNEFTFYGWIDREKDFYKDFVVLNISFFAGSHDTWFTTSSAKYSASISKILAMPQGNHAECIRVEKYLEVPNVIKL